MTAKLVSTSDYLDFPVLYLELIILRVFQIKVFCQHAFNQKIITLFSIRMLYDLVSIK